MKKHNLPSRMLSFLLAFAMLLGFAVIFAALVVNSQREKA